MTPAEIAIVGDLHSFWDQGDVEYFNQSHYQTVLLTGDLGSSRAENGVEIARSLARVRRQLFVMFGNNDATEYARIAAELRYQAGRAELLAGMDSSDSAKGAQGETVVCGFSAHELDVAGLAVTLIAARPFAMGGTEFSYPHALKASFGIESMQQSTQRLFELVDGCSTSHVVFLAHNGPAELGEMASSPFGRDFDPQAGDWGDRDLRQAVDHAVQSGHRVLAVIGGHMHWPLRDGSERQWWVRQEGVLYVNAARVPRHLPKDGNLRRHHISLRLTDDAATASEVWV